MPQKVAEAFGKRNRLLERNKCLTKSLLELDAPEAPTLVQEAMVPTRPSSRTTTPS